MVQKVKLSKGRVVEVGGIKVRLEQDIEFFDNQLEPASPREIDLSKSRVHWRNFVKTKVYIRNGKEIRVVTSKYREHLESARRFDYLEYQLPGNEWRVIEDIHLHGILFPKYRMVMERKANIPWPRKDMKYFKILEPIMKSLINSFRGWQ